MDSGFRRNDGFWTFVEFIKLRFVNKKLRFHHSLCPPEGMGEGRPGFCVAWG